jgi:hypothetical protein
MELSVSNPSSDSCHKRVCDDTRSPRSTANSHTPIDASSTFTSLGCSAQELELRRKSISRVAESSISSPIDSSMQSEEVRRKLTSKVVKPATDSMDYSYSIQSEDLDKEDPDFGFFEDLEEAFGQLNIEVPTNSPMASHEELEGNSIGSLTQDVSTSVQSLDEMNQIAEIFQSIMGEKADKSQNFSRNFVQMIGSSFLGIDTICKYYVRPEEDPCQYALTMLTVARLKVNAGLPNFSIIPEVRSFFEDPRIARLFSKEKENHELVLNLFTFTLNYFMQMGYPECESLENLRLELEEREAAFQALSKKVFEITQEKKENFSFQEIEILQKLVKKSFERLEETEEELKLNQLFQTLTAQTEQNSHWDFTPDEIFELIFLQQKLLKGLQPTPEDRDMLRRSFIKINLF